MLYFTTTALRKVHSRYRVVLSNFSSQAGIAVRHLKMFAASRSSLKPSQMNLAGTGTSIGSVAVPFRSPYLNHVEFLCPSVK